MSKLPGREANRMTLDTPPALPASLWAATAVQPPAYTTAFKGDSVADVVIVGYTGLNAAVHLAQAGRKVVVVEASEPGPHPCAMAARS